MANWKEFVLGIVLFAVFWAFHAGYADSLGTSQWFAGAIIFVILLWAIGYSLMKKIDAASKQFWTFVSAFALVSTFIFSYLGPSLGATMPANPAVLTPAVLGFWLVVFGAAMLVGGHGSKNSTQTWLGILWLFSAVYLAVGTGANPYLHFALIVGLPHIIDGLIRKK